MYLNRTEFLICRIFGGIGLWLMGFLSVVMTLGFAFVAVSGQASELSGAIIIPCCIFLGLFVMFYFFMRKLERAKLYDSFFSEDPDGVMQTHVLAKATGIRQERIIRDLGVFRKMNLFRMDITPQEGYAVITLYELKGAGRKPVYDSIRCPECGAVNRVRRGFVHTCAYCLGSLEEGSYHVSE